MTVTILFFLLSRWPDPLPQIEELQMFPTAAMVEETILVQNKHIAHMTVLCELTGIYTDKQILEAYITQCQQQQEVWLLLADIHRWAVRTDRSVGISPGGLGLPNAYTLWGDEVARYKLIELKKLIGISNYYGGSLPIIPPN